MFLLIGQVKDKPVEYVFNMCLLVVERGLSGVSLGEALCGYCMYKQKMTSNKNQTQPSFETIFHFELLNSLEKQSFF